MSNRIVFALLTIIYLCPVHADNGISRSIKRWIGDTFGINTAEKYTGEKFHPTLANLNTIVLRPCLTEEVTCPAHCVSDLAHTIDQKALPSEAFLTIATTADQKEHHWQVYAGVDDIEQDEAVFVYSRGYAGAEKPEATTGKPKKRGLCEIPKHGGGIVVGAQWLKNEVIHGTCLTFDYPDTRNYFDFGLTNDQECLDLIYQNLKAKTENIVFFGNCRGSKALLNYLSKERPEHVKALVLEAPFMDLERFTTEIGRSYGKIVPFSNKIAKKIITRWYPKYKAEDDITFDDIKQIPQHIPIFIAHLKGDSLVSDAMIKQMVKVLRDSGHTVSLLVIDDKTKSHSRLYQTKPFAQATNAFFAKHGLPHDPKLASEGRILLNRAQANARDIDKWQRGFIHVCKA